MPKGTNSRWVCIRECFDKHCRTWRVGDVIKADVPPMPRHFQRLYSNQAADPIEIMRDKITDLGIEWDEDWDYDRLMREYEVALHFKEEQEAKEAEAALVEKEKSGRKADKK